MLPGRIDMLPPAARGDIIVMTVSGAGATPPVTSNVKLVTPPSIRFAAVIAVRSTDTWAASL